MLVKPAENSNKRKSAKEKIVNLYYFNYFLIKISKR